MYRSIFFSDHCIKQIDSMLPWVCSVIDHRGRQNVVKTTMTQSPAARVPRLCFYHILTSSVIYYWTDARQHGIYLLSILHAGFVLCLSFLFLNMCKMCFRNLHLSKILFFLFRFKGTNLPLKMSPNYHPRLFHSGQSSWGMMIKENCLLNGK